MVAVHQQFVAWETTAMPSAVSEAVTRHLLLAARDMQTRRVVTPVVPALPGEH